MIEHIRSRLLELPNSRPNNNGDEIAILRCPFCGDSHHSNNPHLHIAVKPDGSFKMDCKKCFTQGNMTVEVFHRLGIYDISIDEYLKKLRFSYNKSNFVLFGEDQQIKLTYVDDNKSTNSNEKIDYLISRTKIDFSKKEERESYRIVLDINTFFKENKISPKLNIDKYNQLVQYGIGFVSHDNKSISVRDMSKTSGSDRFTIIQFNDTNRSPYLYIPPCSFDVLTTEPTIVMSEAAFNIICIKKYFFTEDNYNTIFGSTGSVKAYTRTLNKLLYHSCYFGGTIICYVDNDETFDLELYKKEFSMYLSSFTIKLVVNQNGKDFGKMPEEGECFDFKVYKL